jgi:hypothetical protein
MRLRRSINCGRSHAVNFVDLHSVSFVCGGRQNGNKHNIDAIQPQSWAELLAHGMVHKIPLQDDEEA